MPIGKLGRSSKRKKHAGYKSLRQARLPPRTLKVPRGTGFTELQAQALYDKREHRLIVTVTAKRSPENLGPGIFERRVIPDWHRHQVAQGEHVTLLDSILAEYAEKLAGKVFPETRLCIDECAPEGSQVLAFTESTCSRCLCWYCELSSA